MEYKTNYFIQSYASRTWENYRQLKQIHEEDLRFKQCSVFEVTQLINSFFGILIVPFEASKPFKDKNKPENTIKSYRSSLRKMKSADEDAIKKISSLIEKLNLDHRYYNDYPFDKKNVDLLPILFLERLRNALSHGGDTGLRFFPTTVSPEEDDAVSCISSVIFVDKSKDGSFVVELSIDEMESLLELLHTIFTKYQIVDKLEAGKYNKNIEELRTLMREESSNM